MGAARSFFTRWYWWATHSGLAPMIKVARMLKRHLRKGKKNYVRLAIEP